MSGRNNKGIMLISVFGVMVVLFCLLGVYGLRSINESHLAQRHRYRAEAFYLAEAGSNEFVARLRDGQAFADIGNPAGSSGVSMGNGQYWLEAFPAATPPYAIATGCAGGIERRIKIELGIDLPNPENALSIFGSPSQHANLNIHESDNKNMAGEILVSGFDLSGGPDRLALGVEDAATLAALIDSLGGKLKQSGDLEDTLVGDPMNNFTDSNGNDFTASIGQTVSEGYDADLMETVVQVLADNVRALTPTVTLDLDTDKDDFFLDAYKDAGGTVRLGSSSSDVIYIAGGKKLELKKEADPLTIVGTGTLVVDGAKLDLKHADFDWTGDIYILGGATGRKNDAEFKIRHADVDIDGDIFLLSNTADTAGKGKVKMDIHNDSGKHDASTTIRGSILGFGGTGDKSKAELKVHHGSLDMEGFISMMGTKTKLDIHQQAPKDGNNSNINIRGGICLLVPEAEKEKQEKAEIKLHARGGGEGEFKIQYDSAIVRAALERLRNKLSGLPSRLLQVTSWQEL